MWRREGEGEMKERVKGGGEIEEGGEERMEEIGRRCICNICNKDQWSKI